MRTWDIWTERATSAYSGKGPARARGYEHHVVSFGRKPTLHAEVNFDNFGSTRYVVEAHGGAKPGSTCTYSDGLVIEARRRGDAWNGTVDDNGDRCDFSLALDVPAGTPVLPSFIARWLGVGSTTPDEVIGAYVAVPEDGWGGWRPPRKQWFPVMNAHPRTVCTVVTAPIESVAFGRTTKRVRPLVHRDGAGEEVARLLLDPESGEPLRYEQLGCVLSVVDESRARARASAS